MLYFVGDIHGKLDELMQTLKSINFDFKKDKLIAVGDLVDRGTQNEEVVYLLDEDWFDSVRGNHDEWVITAYNDPNFDSYHHRIHGGEWFYSLSKNEQYEIVSRLSNLPYYLEVEYEGIKFGVVHAEVPYYHWCWNKFKDDISKENMNTLVSAIWGRNIIEAAEYAPVLENIDFLVHGHTGVTEPYCVKNRMWIDTGYLGEGLTIISAEDIIKICKEGDIHVM